jgi:chemotaxis receptor (MCP) glutamine deamidase CheD
MMIVTVLGSCVSACIRDRVSGMGGMNHFMLPDGGGDDGSPVSASARYGTYAMEVLINEVLKAGARRENLEAKVFGGGACCAASRPSTWASAMPNSCCATSRWKRSAWWPKT